MSVSLVQRAPVPQAPLPTTVGLTAQEVAERVRRGDINGVPASPTYFFSHDMAQVSFAESRTPATIALTVDGLLVLGHISRPLKVWRWPLIGSMATCLVLALTVPPSSKFFARLPGAKNQSAGAQDGRGSLRSLKGVRTRFGDVCRAAPGVGRRSAF